MTVARLAPDPPPARVARYILGTRVDATNYDDATDRIIRWAEAGESRYVCVSTVHMVMEGYDDPSFRDVVTSADLVTPDGMPLVWTLRLLGASGVSRTYGPTLTPTVCARAARDSIPVGFFGGALRRCGSASRNWTSPTALVHRSGR
jgi:N-acetylglucosaminyldiphosphoundecaprenol N-acetyl-beta-D-mannosaminyltransferase